MFCPRCGGRAWYGPGHWLCNVCELRFEAEVRNGYTVTRRAIDPAKPSRVKLLSPGRQCDDATEQRFALLEVDDE